MRVRNMSPHRHKADFVTNNAKIVQQNRFDKGMSHNCVTSRKFYLQISSSHVIKELAHYSPRYR